MFDTGSDRPGVYSTPPEVERALEGDGRWRGGRWCGFCASCSLGFSAQQKMGGARAGLVSTVRRDGRCSPGCATGAAHLEHPAAKNKQHDK